MNAATPETTIVNTSFNSITKNKAKFYANTRLMKIYINISNAPVEISKVVRRKFAQPRPKKGKVK